MRTIRVTGGKWLGRRVSVSNAYTLRPSTDSCRETLFNWLGQDLTGLSCLDLFAGTGILGIESVSRGASQVVLIERDRSVFKVLRHNCAQLESDVFYLLCRNAFNVIDSLVRLFPGRVYDIIFLDPPYRHGFLEKILIEVMCLTHENTHIYCEMEKELSGESLLKKIPGWLIHKERQSGGVRSILLKRML